ncbi:hypothetical protein IW262DRAFT_1282122, partial [Armillaria fumosa]
VGQLLHHLHILPLLGVNENLFTPRFCLISSWMCHGNIIQYLQDNPNAAQEQLELVYAIQWLHGLQPPVVHAKSKGYRLFLFQPSSKLFPVSFQANILIGNNMHCYLADFGLTFVIETFNPQRTVQWLASEYLHPSSSTEAYITSHNMYAFGCTIVEVILLSLPTFIRYTGNPPFSFLMHDLAVIYEVLVNKNQPPHPAADIFPSDDL